MARFILIAVLIFIFPNVIYADTDSEIKNIKKQIKEIQQTYLENNKDMAGAISKAEGLVNESTQLQGKIETNTHLIETSQKENLRFLQELEQRITAIEQRMSIVSHQVSNALSKIAPKDIAEGNLYQKALDNVSQARYLQALSNFKSFTKKYPKSKFIPDAKFWIGECHSSLREYKLSIKAFQKFIDKYPKNENVPAAIFKQGFAFEELDYKEDAKLFYNKTIKEYPKSKWSIQAKQRLENLKSNNMKNTTKQNSDIKTSYPKKTVQQKKKSNIKENKITAIEDGDKRMMKPKDTKQQKGWSVPNIPQGGF